MIYILHLHNWQFYSFKITITSLTKKSFNNYITAVNKLKKMRILKVDFIKIGYGMIYNQITKAIVKIGLFAKNRNSKQTFLTFYSPLFFIDINNE